MNPRNAVLGLFAALVLAGCSPPSLPGGNPAADGQASAPSLRIVSPKDGDSVQQPVAIEYVITGIDANAIQQYRLRVAIDSPPISTTDVVLTGLQGTVVLSSDKLVTGRRNLVFTLVKSDGTTPANPAATVRVRGVTIAGGR